MKSSFNSFEVKPQFKEVAKGAGSGKVPDVAKPSSSVNSRSVVRLSAVPRHRTKVSQVQKWTADLRKSPSHTSVRAPTISPALSPKRAPETSAFEATTRNSRSKIKLPPLPKELQVIYSSFIQRITMKMILWVRVNIIAFVCHDLMI